MNMHPPCTRGDPAAPPSRARRGRCARARAILARGRGWPARLDRADGAPRARAAGDAQGASLSSWPVRLCRGCVAARVTDSLCATAARLVAGRVRAEARV